MELKYLPIKKSKFMDIIRKFYLCVMKQKTYPLNDKNTVSYNKIFLVMLN